jgi:hypothetical protein
MITINAMAKADGSITIDMSQFAPGVYYVQSESRTYKITKL